MTVPTFLLRVLLCLLFVAALGISCASSGGNDDDDTANDDDTLLDDDDVVTDDDDDTIDDDDIANDDDDVANDDDTANDDDDDDIDLGEPPVMHDAFVEPLAVYAGETQEVALVVSDPDGDLSALVIQEIDSGEQTTWPLATTDWLSDSLNEDGTRALRLELGLEVLDEPVESGLLVWALDEMGNISEIASLRLAAYPLDYPLIETARIEPQTVSLGGSLDVELTGIDTNCGYSVIHAWHVVPEEEPPTELRTQISFGDCRFWRLDIEMTNAGPVGEQEWLFFWTDDEGHDGNAVNLRFEVVP